MTIPSFAASGVLPPYLGDPAKGDRSPYRVDVTEVIDRFATSAKRCEILLGWLTFRAEVHKLGIVAGYQWLDGSFCEDLTHARREPNDIDIVTFAQPPLLTGDAAQSFLDRVAETRPDLTDPRQTKQRYLCDAYWVQLSDADANAEVVHYWYGLFSHRRGDDTWKGMVQVPLDPSNDKNAERALKLAVRRIANATEAAKR